MDNTEPKNSAQSDNLPSKTEHTTSEQTYEIPSVEVILTKVKQANSRPNGLDCNKK